MRSTAEQNDNTSGFFPGYARVAQHLLRGCYVPRVELLGSLGFMRQNEVWPMVTEIRPLNDAEAVHPMVE